jgi:hypothetical protein
MDRGGTSYQNMVDDDFPKGVTVLEAHSEVQNLDFTRASTDQGIYNHHNVFMDLVRPVDVYGCEAGIIPHPQVPMTVLAAGATEDGTIRYWSEDGTIKSGYYLTPNRKIMNMIDVRRTKYDSIRKLN